MLAILLLVFPFAEEPGWQQLLEDNRLEAWIKPSDDWIFTDRVEIHPENPKLLRPSAGKGPILINGLKGHTRDLYTKEKYGDLQLHMEFFIPRGSNSGVKFHGVYEIQICDSHGKKNVTGSDCGGIYPRATFVPNYHHIDEGIAPKINAAKPPGEWQTLDVEFLAPRFDAQGKKIANAQIRRAELNGQVIHLNQEMQTPTGNNWEKPEKATGPLMLQADHGPVAFRNVRVRPLPMTKK